MYTTNVRLLKHTSTSTSEYKVEFNAYHVHISDKAGNMLYSRDHSSSSKGEWLDPSHTKITKALSDLEDALLEAIEGK